MGDVVSIRSIKGLKCFDCGQVLRDPEGFFTETLTDDHYIAYTNHTATDCIRYLRCEMDAMQELIFEQLDPMNEQ